MNPSMAPRIAAARTPLPGGTSANGRGHPEALVESYRRLAEVFHEVMSEQSLDALLDRIAVTLADLMPYEALHIYEADEARRELVPVLARSPEYEEEIMNDRPKFDEGLTGWAVTQRTPVWTNEAHLDPRVAVIPGTPNEPEAMIVVPLIARGALKGALNIYRLGAERGVRRARVRARQVVRRRGRAGARQRADPRAARASRPDRLADRSLQPPLLPRPPPLGADARLALARLGGGADVRPRRLQARQRRLRPRRRRPAARAALAVSRARPCAARTSSAASAARSSA